jgi:hypothetical protein
MDSSFSHYQEDKLSFNTPIRHSKPIQIPTRRCSFDDLDCSPITRTRSPELIFEMSPPCSEYSFGSEHCLNCPRAYSSDDTKPLLYTFPVISKSSINQTRRPLGRIPSSSPIHSASVYPKAWPKRRFRKGCENVVHGSPTMKVNGFTPITASVPLEPLVTPPPSPSPRLSPAPSWSAFSSSPWILPGASSDEDDDVDSPEGSPSNLHFDQLALRRLEQKSGQRLRRSLPISSMRVSCY